MSTTKAPAKAAAKAAAKANSGDKLDQKRKQEKDIEETDREQSKKATRSQQKQKKKDKADSKPAAVPTEIPTESQEMEDKANKDGPEEEERDVQLVYWDGNIPTPVGNVGKRFKSDPCSQLRDALALLRFMKEDEVDFKLLDLETDVTLCMVAIPGQNQRTVRIIYGIGTGAGASGIKDSAIKANFLALTGEWVDGISMPNVMTLPSTALDIQEFRIPSEEVLEATRLSAPTKTTGWFAALELRERAKIPLVMPVPAFLVLDGLKTDLDALVVYERWLHLKGSMIETEGLSEYSTALTSFIAALLTSGHDSTIKLKQSTFVLAPCEVALKWKKHRIMQLFPANTAKVPNQSESQTSLLVDKIAKVIVHATDKSTKAPTMEENDDDTKKSELDEFKDIASKKYKLCTRAFQNLIIMCGLGNDEHDQIPHFWREIAEKDANANDKLGMARNNLARHYIFKEAKVPPMHPLLSMFVSRRFEEETTLNTLKSACMGLTPFAVPSMTDSEVEEMNEQATALAQATSTTIQDVTKNSLKAKSPHTFEGLIAQIY